VSGIHLGLIGEKARAVMVAEDDRKKLAELEASAQWVALGINTPGAVVRRLWLWLLGWCWGW